MSLSPQHFPNQHDPDAPQALLGGLSIAQFLRDYWHKKPLLVRQAIPQFAGLLSPDELAGLACEDQVQSRIVIQTGNTWQLEHGPFAEKRFARLPQHDWSLLVQAVNHHLPQAQQLLQRFNFLPYARLDDLMVSYAPDGGGVGPHFDSYDVFLLQGLGQRRWRISEQTDLRLLPNVPLKILENFSTTQEWLLDAGDMLYLPPHLAHWGIAVGECMTYSIGLRAPTHDELIKALMNYLHDQDWGEQRYQDADLQFNPRPAQIDAAMIQRVEKIVQQIQLKPSLIGQFLASYLSEPKPDVLFAPPQKRMSVKQFSQRAATVGIRLALQSQMLYSADGHYINGEAISVAAQYHSLLQQLADTRSLSAEQLSALPDTPLAEQLHAYWQYGWIELAD